MRACTASATAWPPTSLCQGLLLKAQARLGHRDPATTLRHYSHAIPLDDTDVADQLDGLLNGLDGSVKLTALSQFRW
jgi:hypothetical protein